MKVESNALNMVVSGTHTFDNKVDYNIQIKLSELLSRKMKKREKEFGPIEEDDQGQMTLFLRMTGDAEAPEFHYDKKSVRKKLKEGMKKEKNELKEAFKSEFNQIFKKNKPAIEKEYEPLELEWDENESVNDDSSKNKKGRYNLFKEKLKKLNDQ